MVLFTGCSLDFKDIENPDELVTLSELRRVEADTILYKVSVKGITVRLSSQDNVLVKESQPNKFPLLTMHASVFIFLVIFAFVAVAMLLNKILD